MRQALMDCFAHPVKCKIILEIQAAGQVTAKQLAKKYGDIPQATLYRYLKRMIDDGILKIVQETQVRGTVERTYALAFDWDESVREMGETNSGEAYMQMFMQYITGLMRQFQAYCARPDINIAEDKSGFTYAPIYATDEELMDAVAQHVKAFAPLVQNLPTPERKLRTIGLIITPPENP